MLTYRNSMRLLLVAAAAALAGCASVAEGTVESSREILLTSQPSLARVTQGARILCETPCRVRQGQLRYGQPFTFTFRSGETIDVDPRMQANGQVLGNLIFGGGLGFVVDAASGRLMISDSHVHAIASEESGAAR
jgi:hypothetical protein